MRIGLAGVGKTIVAAAMLIVAVLLAALNRHRTEAPSPGPMPTQAAKLAVSSGAMPEVPCGDLARLVVPVQGLHSRDLSDTFNDARSEGRRHDAIDIMAPVGTPIIAAADGQVERLFLSHDGGNTIYLRSPDGYIVYYYAHLDSYAPGLEEGQTVRQGTRLGSVGFSGNANPASPHLHLAIFATVPSRKWWEQSQPLNPFVYLTRKKSSRDCRSAA